MAATVFHGKRGKVTFNNAEIVGITSWQATVTCETAESSPMHATNTAKEHYAGFLDWKASIDYDLQSVTALQITEGTQYQLELWNTATAGDGIWYGDAVCTGASYSTDSKGVAKGTYTFEGNDADGLQWAVADPA